MQKFIKNKMFPIPICLELNRSKILKIKNFIIGCLAQYTKFKVNSADDQKMLNNKICHFRYILDLFCSKHMQIE